MYFLSKVNGTPFITYNLIALLSYMFSTTNCVRKSGTACTDLQYQIKDRQEPNLYKDILPYFGCYLHYNAKYFNDVYVNKFSTISQNTCNTYQLNTWFT